MSFIGQELRECPRRRQVQQMSKEEWRKSLQDQIDLKKNAKLEEKEARRLEEQREANMDMKPHTVSHVNSGGVASKATVKSNPNHAKPSTNQDEGSYEETPTIVGQEQASHENSRTTIAEIMARNNIDKAQFQVNKVKQDKVFPNSDRRLNDHRDDNANEMVQQFKKDCESIKNENEKIKKQMLEQESVIAALRKSQEKATKPSRQEHRGSSKSRVAVQNQKKARAEMEAKAKAEARACARAKVEAEIIAKAEAKAEARELARIRAEEEAKVKAKVRAEAKAEARAKGEAKAEARARAEAKSIAKAEAKLENKSKLRTKSMQLSKENSKSTTVQKTKGSSRKFKPPSNSQSKESPEYQYNNQKVKVEEKQEDIEEKKKNIEEKKDDAKISDLIVSNEFCSDARILSSTSSFIAVDDTLPEDDELELRTRSSFSLTGQFSSLNL